jgi:hypothetical protein
VTAAFDVLTDRIAHAAVAGLDLLTREIGRYHTDVPTFRLITQSS